MSRAKLTRGMRLKPAWCLSAEHNGAATVALRDSGGLDAPDRQPGDKQGRDNHQERRQVQRNSEYGGQYSRHFFFSGRFGQFVKCSRISRAVSFAPHFQPHGILTPGLPKPASVSQMKPDCKPLLRRRARCNDVWQHVARIVAAISRRRQCSVLWRCASPHASVSRRDCVIPVGAVPAV